MTTEPCERLTQTHDDSEPPRGPAVAPIERPQAGSAITGTDAVAAAGSVSAKPEEAPGGRVGSSNEVVGALSDLAGVWRSQDSLSCQMYGTVGADTMIRGFVDAFARACGSGLMLRYLSRAIVPDAKAGIVLDPSALLTADLNEQLARVRLQATNLPTAIATAQHPRSLKRLQEELDSAYAEEENLLAAIAGAASNAAEVIQPREFEFYGEVVAAALEKLLRCGNSLSQADKHEFWTLLSSFWLEARDDGNFLAFATVRVTTPPEEPGGPLGVAELGPISWVVPANGRKSGAHLTMLDDRRISLPRISRTYLREQLIGVGGLTAEGALAVLNAPIEAPLVLAHSLLGWRLPAFVTGRWLDDDWVEHLVASFSNPDFSWFGKGRYTASSHLSQAVLYFAQDGKDFTASEACAALQLRGNRSVAIFASTAGVVGGRTLPAILEREEIAGSRASLQTRLRGIRCVCGRIATISAVRPEVPAGLLCVCLRMPGAPAFGMPPDFRFPATYAQRPSEATCLAVLAGRASKRNIDLNDTLSAILAAGHLLEDGTSAATLSQRMFELGLQSSARRLDQPMSQLRQLGYAEREVRPRPPTRGAVPAIWRLTAEGQKRGAELLAARQNDSGNDGPSDLVSGSRHNAPYGRDAVRSAIPRSRGPVTTFRSGRQ